jgi:hypothetical protein
MPLDPTGTRAYTGQSRITDKGWLVMDRGLTAPDPKEINKMLDGTSNVELFVTTK